MTHLVSVLVPAFNAEKWIGETLQSVLEQSWRPLEIVVVDDGSADGTAAIVEAMRRPEVRLIRQPNRGQCAAENRALSEARGEFIQYLDADDLISPRKIEIQMRRIAGLDGGIASGEWARFYTTPAHAIVRPEPVWKDMNAVDWLVEALTGGEPMMQAGLWLLPRKVLEAAGPWDERLSLINDFDYFCRVLLAARQVLFCPGATLFYRSGVGGTLSGTRSTEAWHSALTSMTLGTAALLRVEDTPRVRRACADVFRTLEFQSYPDCVEVSRAAGHRVEELGGSAIRPEGGRAFRSATAVLGWRAAVKLQRLAYSLGYGPVARWKGHRWREAASKAVGR